MGEPQRSGVHRLSWGAALAVGCVLRLLPICAARPYIAYVDEGNFLHAVAAMLRTGEWDPGEYLYPELPRLAVAAGARVYAPLYRLRHGSDLRESVSPPPEVYDRLQPFALLGIARGIDVSLGMGTVVLAALLAASLAGPAAGGAALWLAALAPALVLRAPIASVDSSATFFATLCLYFCARASRSSRPGLLYLLAGGAAGFAFASKYPAVLVATAATLTALITKLRWNERLRRVALLGAGVVAGTIVAMPAVVTRTRDVIAAIRVQGAAYTSFASGTPLWRQALWRAEWDFPYEHPELGVLFVAAAAAGLVAMLRGRETAPAGWGWAAWAAASLALYATRTFQPFRNAMPLVPAACAAAGIGYARLRSRLPRPLRLDATALACLLMMWGAPLAAYGWRRARLADSRRLAVDWLAGHSKDREATLIVRDLGILDTELARVSGRKDVRWWSESEPAIRELAPDRIVAGVQRQTNGATDDAALEPWIAARYRVVARFGSRATAPLAGWWRGNDQVVYVFERVAR
ncbi:MAG TPA: glycosyltransferase family 39 protein [Thermoanaerobaculia bacterium]|nr:glycosyltransferase family 39 protein [Thermoanaerobaculia bacterium]